VDGDGIGHFRGADNGRNVQVTFGGTGWADAHGLVGEADVHQVTVCTGVHSDSLDAQLLARPQDTKCNFAAIGNQNFIKHEFEPISEVNDRSVSAVSDNRDQRLIELNRFAVFNKNGFDDAGMIGFNLVHHLHGFHDADDIANLDVLTYFHKLR
jgi:hypothetical protein